MGKFADLIVKCEEQKKAAAEAANVEFNKMVNEVSEIFMNPDNYENLESRTFNSWSFTLKLEEDVKKFMSLLEKLNIGHITFESGHFYKNTCGKRTFTIECSEKDIDLIFDQIKEAFENLKR